MLVKMKQDQHYIAVSGAKECALAGDVVDIDPLFAKYIKGKFDIYVEEELKDDGQDDGQDNGQDDGQDNGQGDDNGQDESKEKPLDRMNKDELIAKAKTLEIDLSDEQFADLKKAEIIELIQQIL